MLNVLETSTPPWRACVFMFWHHCPTPRCSPAHSSSRGCCWHEASSQSELRRVPLTAAMPMKSSPLPHWAVHHPLPGLDVHDVTSQAERPSARGRLSGYFCRRPEHTHKHKALMEFLLIKRKRKLFSEVMAKKCQG